MHAKIGGEGGIRTHDPLTGTPVLKFKGARSDAQRTRTQTPACPDSPEYSRACDLQGIGRHCNSSATVLATLIGAPSSTPPALVALRPDFLGRSGVIAQIKRPARGWNSCCVERVAYAFRRRLRPNPARPRPSSASVPDLQARVHWVGQKSGWELVAS